MKIPKKSNAYIATWNNPQKHCEALKDFDYTTATEAEFTALKMQVISMFVNASARARKAETSSITVGCELSPSGTFHCHMLFAAKRKLEFANLQKIYPSIHLERPMGTYEECVNYIHKQGTEANEIKAGTKLCEPTTWGEYEFTQEDMAAKQSIFNTINDLLDDGLTPQRIYAESPKLAFYANAIERTYNARKSSEIPLEREITTYYHVGEPGTGKSHIYHDLVQQYEYENVYRIGGEYTNIWDEYQYQKCVIFDDLRGSLLRYSVLLEYLQGYKKILKCRYANKYADYNEVHITTVIPPEHLYDWDNREKFNIYDGKEQLYRRIDYIVYHWKDDTGYHQHQIPFDQYSSYADLQRQVIKAHPEALKYINPFLSTK